MNCQSYMDIPYYMHTSYETHFTAAFQDMGTLIHFREAYKDPISNKYTNE